MKKTVVNTVVIIIFIGLVIGVLGPNLTCKIYSECHDMRTISDAIELYRNNEGELPPSLEEIVKETRGRTSYIKKLPKDPWGNSYFYFYNGKGEFFIGSYGQDGVLGGQELNRDIYFHEKPCSNFMKENYY